MKKIALLLFLLPALSYAGGDKNDCDHPRFQEVGCSYPGEQGPPGADGKDGKDGEDGVDGRDGKDGIDGIDGRDGKDGRDGRDGVVPTDWIEETRIWQRNWGRFSAASEAIQVHLPQEEASRVTFGIASVHGTNGYGVGYAYKNEDGVAVTVGIGTSGGHTVGKASVGFEFGGRREPMKVNFVEYVKSDISEEAVIVEPEYEEILQQQHTIEIDHVEDIEKVQLAQNDLEQRLQSIEAQRVNDARRQAAYEAEQERKREESRAYAQKTLAELEQYK